MQNRDSQKTVRASVTIALYVLCALVVLERLQWIISLQYVPSTDGYFYLQEIRHRAIHGSGYYVTTSPFFWLAGHLSSVFGISEMNVFHLLVALSLTALSGAVATPVRGWLRPAMILLVWASDVLFFRHYAFLQQAMSMALVTFALAIHATGIKSYRSSLMALVMLLFAATIHLFGALLVACLIPAIGYFYKESRRIYLMMGVLVGCGAFFYIWNHPKQLFTWPESFELGWIQTCSTISCSATEWAEFIFFSLLWLTLFIESMFRSRRDLCVGLLVGCLVLNLPFWTSDGHMQMRLAFSSVWLLLMAITVRSEIFNRASYRWLVPIIVFFSMGLSTVLESRNYSATTFPFADIASAAPRLRTILPENAFILAPHGLQFAATYYLNHSSASSFPKNKQRYQLFRLVKSARISARCPRVEEFQPSMNKLECIRISSDWIMRK